MDSVPKQKQSADVLQWITWAHANRKRLQWIAIGVAVVGLAIGFYYWNAARQEANANEALSALRAPIQVGNSALHIAPDEYLKVANDFPGTSAGQRALLMAAGGLFDAGKFPEAEAQFQKFLTEYPGHPLAVDAEIGVAASLEAQGKLADATARYKETRERHMQEPIPQPAMALARLYALQGKPDVALKLYEEVAHNRGNDTWGEEAELGAQEILNKHPELRPQPAPPPVSAVTPPLSPLAGAPAGGPPPMTTSAPPVKPPVVPPVASSNAPTSFPLTILTNKP
jgi:TolA-binding protein